MEYSVNITASGISLVCLRNSKKAGVCRFGDKEEELKVLSKNYCKLKYTC